MVRSQMPCRTPGLYDMEAERTAILSGNDGNPAAESDLKTSEKANAAPRTSLSGRQRAQSTIIDSGSDTGRYATRSYSGAQVWKAGSYSHLKSFRFEDDHNGQGISSCFTDFRRETALVVLASPTPSISLEAPNLCPRGAHRSQDRVGPLEVRDSRFMYTG